jgi:Domain of unknown function (DUF397)
MVRDSGWFKSSYSTSGGASCVEVRFTDSIGVRDSKNRDAGALRLTSAAWATFLSDLATAPTVPPRGRQQ